MKTTFRKVLLVDDNEVDRYIATRNMNKYMFAEEVITMDSAIKALEYLRSLEGTPELIPQLIFLDIRMPGIDGFEFLEEYGKLSDEIQRQCIIMMLSTSLSPYDHERANKSRHVTRLLNKPLDKAKLSELENLFRE